ncbi:hypothetical protein BH24ACT26_BH24ACT26_08790 [soil metagenome]
MSVVWIDERLLLGLTMIATECTECGAELRLRPARCPLCGADAQTRTPKRAGTDVETYQGDVRSLREQLRKLREGAEAV